MVFDLILDRAYGARGLALAPDCAASKQFDQFLANVATPFEIDGRVLRAGDAVFSLDGMTIRRSTIGATRFGFFVPVVTVQVGGDTIDLRFSTTAEANDAFTRIASAMSGKVNPVLQVQ